VFVKSTIGDIHRGELICRPRDDRFGEANEVRDGGSNEGEMIAIGVVVFVSSLDHQSLEWEER